MAEYDILKVLKPLLNETKLTLTFNDKDHVGSEYDTISTFKAKKPDKEWLSIGIPYYDIGFAVWLRDTKKATPWCCLKSLVIWNS